MKLLLTSTSAVKMGSVCGRSHTPKDVGEDAVVGGGGEIVERGNVGLDSEVKQCQPSDFKKSR